MLISKQNVFLPCCKSPEYYNKLAEIYDDLYLNEQLEKINLIYKILGKRSYGRCVDLGCGSGISSILLKKICKEVIGVDYSIEMLKRSKSKSFRNLILGSIEYLPLKFDSFDFILSLSTLHDLKYFKLGVYGIYKIMKRDSEAIISFRKEFDERFKIKHYLSKLFIIIDRKQALKEWIYYLRKRNI